MSLNARYPCYLIKFVNIEGLLQNQDTRMQKRQQTAILQSRIINDLQVLVPCSWVFGPEPSNYEPHGKSRPCTRQLWNNPRPTC